MHRKPSLKSPLSTISIAAKLVSTLALGFAALGFSASQPAAAADNVLNIYNWSDYIAPTTVPDFEKETGIKVRYDTFDSNETLFAKMVAGDTGYDLVVPSSNWAAIDIKGGLLLPIDKSKIPNYKNLNPELMKLLAQVDPGNKYLIPWMWGYTTVGINVGKVKQALGSTPMPANPWDLVFNPTYANKLKSCGISFLDSGGDIMEAAFNYLGIPQATNNPADFEKAYAMVQKIRPDVSEFSSSGYINDLAGGNICASLGWSGDMGIASHRAKEAKNGVDIKVFPPTHGAVIFIDTMDIPADAKHVDNAYKFLNYRLQPKVCAADTNTVYYANPVPASLPMVLPRVKDNDYVFLDPAMMNKLIPPKVYTSEERRLVTRLYTKFKTGL
ncbi:putrescine transporter subunit: periplasmic-binding component of ABC superfamily [Thiomonas sp. X19]|uniref:polyamine ABC transporter substrate-binding protein n=1 Tax=Thiomonas sp. X19 TaxID=1050370 RepID=UPI000B73E678|nr:polyamine ABC transporter substrate-binding protein [Thiomonas sp. X19]SCC91646.1 putrescine transporter subunit: periplasmic-binding component of ABC superfamily [Thiomonas sp. X19]